MRAHARRSPVQGIDHADRIGLVHPCCNFGTVKPAKSIDLVTGRCLSLDHLAAEDQSHNPADHFLVDAGKPHWPDQQACLLEHFPNESFIDLMAPLREDLDAWRQLAGDPPDSGLMFPTRAGDPWRTHDWKNWERRVWRPTAAAAGVTEPPYSLRHSFASLQLYAGLTIVELAAQMGHSPAICLSTYQHVMADLKGTERLPAETRIEVARRGTDVAQLELSHGDERPPHGVVTPT